MIKIKGANYYHNIYILHFKTALQSAHYKWCDCIFIYEIIQTVTVQGYMMMKSEDLMSLHGFSLSNRSQCKAFGLLFVVSTRAFTPRQEMGVTNQMLGVKSPFRFGEGLESHLLTCNVSWNFVLM